MKFSPIIISPTGEATLWPTNVELTMKNLQMVVEGYVEVVSVLYKDKPAMLIVNEDGIAHGLQPNPRATAIYWTASLLGKSAGGKFDPLQGPMIQGRVVFIEADKQELDNIIKS